MSTMPRNEKDFLNDCDPDDHEQFGRLFADVADLARSAAADSTMQVEWRFEDRRGAALRVTHPRLRGETTIMWAYPSRNHDRNASRSGLEIHAGPLIENGVREPEIRAYEAELRDAGFEDVGTKTLRTQTAGLEEGFSRMYRFPAHRE